MSKKVSIIVPVHNASDYLEGCVSSLLKQTYTNLEIILINNASKDNSLELCHQLGGQDARIVVIHTDEPGVSNARNLGLDAMTGDFVTFVDSDDWLELGCIELALETLQTKKADVVVWSFFKNTKQRELQLSLLPKDKECFATEEEKAYLYKKSIYAQYDKISESNDVSVGTVWGKLYPSQLINDNNLRFIKSLVRAQDVVFTINAFSCANIICYLDESLYHYRIHSESTCQSGRFISDTCTPFNDLLNEFIKFAQESSSREDVLNIVNYRIVQVIYWHLDHNYFHAKNKKPFLARRNEFLSLISRGYYKEALDNVELEKLPKQRKVMVFLLRKRMVFMFYIFEKLLLIRNRFLQLNN